MRGRAVFFAPAMLAALSIAVSGAYAPLRAEEGARPPAFTPEPVVAELAERVLALDPERISAADVRDLLSRVPAPRIFLFQGSLAPVTMLPFANFLIAMGYPEATL